MSRKQPAGTNFRKTQDIAAEMAGAIERVRRQKGECDSADLNARGFTNNEIRAFGDDAKALHAKAHPDLAQAA